MNERMHLEQQAVRTMLGWRTVAVVGLSGKPGRPSLDVAAYLQRHGYRIVPVNPAFAGQAILGEPCHATLAEAAQALAAGGGRIDWVDTFRKAEDVPPVVAEAIAIGARGVWLQLGIVNDDAVEAARAAGLLAVQDHCSKIEHMRLSAVGALA
ncbi:CoA-binding protein [Imbroritus primus]